MEIYPCVLQDIGPLGSLPKKSVLDAGKKMNAIKIKIRFLGKMVQILLLIIGQIAQGKIFVKRVGTVSILAKEVIHDITYPCFMKNPYRTHFGTS